ncbi:AAA family ATPase [Wolbachia endosymbiont of Oedothorax gibbosus]|uniref:AAA family ATPase n=1 Tax=Wolbachia endosymbiont of Oedothorax gibbosus TaxID=931100 RepID=UPI00202457E4|nr:ATP-binding protein [Wolbachia endosymbiont of Oedothorax gibbosus]
MKITWRGFFKFVLLCLAITAFIYLIYLTWPSIKATAATISFMPIVIKSAVVTCAVAGTATALLVFGAICVGVYELMKSPKVKNVPEQRDVTEQKVTLDDVIATDEVKKELQVICNNLSKEGREKLKKLNVTGKITYILHGPPGNGKALIAEAIATKTNLPFLSISGRELSISYFSEYDNLLKDAKKKPRCIVFIDGIDASTRYDKETQLTRLEELSKLKSDVTLIVSAKSVDALDQQLVERSYYLGKIHIPQPDENLRKQTLDTHLKGRVEQGVSLEEIINKTEGFSLGMLHSLVNTVKFNAASHIGRTDVETYVTEDDLEGALEKLTNKNNNTPTKSDRIEEVTLDDIILQDDIKQQVREFCEFQSDKDKQINNELKIKENAALLLYGPPGTGKTMIAKVIATETKVSFKGVSASAFVDQYVGSGAKSIRELFEDARRSAPCIVFIDEFDAIGKDRRDHTGSGAQVYIEALEQLLTELDGLESNEGVKVIAATNYLEVLDPALRDRFTRIEVNLPGEAQRKEILEKNIKDVKKSSDVDLESIAQQTKNFSGRRLSILVDSAKRNARNRIKRSEESTIEITMGDFTKPLEEIQKETEKEREQEKARKQQANDNVIPLIMQANTQQLQNQAVKELTS